MFFVFKKNGPKCFFESRFTHNRYPHFAYVFVSFVFNFNKLGRNQKSHRSDRIRIRNPVGVWSRKASEEDWSSNFYSCSLKNPVCFSSRGLHNVVSL